MIIANDPTVRGGAINPCTVEEVVRATEIAAGEPAPDRQPRRVGRRRPADPEGDLHPRRRALPRPDPALGGRASRRSRWSSATRPPAARTCPGMSDYVVMVKERAKVFLGGPPLVKMATGEESDDESLGGAEMHARDLRPRRLPRRRRARRAPASAAQIVARLNWRKRGPGPGAAPADEPRHDPEELLGIVPADLQGAVRPARGHRPASSTAPRLRRVQAALRHVASSPAGRALHGYPVGILANAQRRALQRGGAEGDAVHPARQPDRHPAALPAEHHRLHGRQGVRAGRHHQARREDDQRGLATRTVPHLTRIMGASYGAGNYGMSGRAYDPRFLFTWPQREVGGDGPGSSSPACCRSSRGSRRPAQGEPFDEEADAAMRRLVEAQIEARVAARSSCHGRLYDDGDHRPARHPHRARHRACPRCTANEVERAPRLRRLPDVIHASSCSSPTAARSRGGSSATCRELGIATVAVLLRRRRGRCRSCARPTTPCGCRAAHPPRPTCAPT